MTGRPTTVSTAWESSELIASSSSTIPEFILSDQSIAQMIEVDGLGPGAKLVSEGRRAFLRAVGD